MGRVEVKSAVDPTDAKLDTSTRVRRDSQDGHPFGRSRSADEVSTSNVRPQSAQRYS